MTVKETHTINDYLSFFPIYKNFNLTEIYYTVDFFPSNSAFMDFH